MTIPQLEFQFFFGNILWSIIFFILFFLVFSIFLDPIYKKIIQKNHKFQKNQQLLKDLKNNTEHLEDEITTLETNKNQALNENNFIKNDKINVLLLKNKQEKEDVLLEELKNVSLKYKNTENLDDIIKDQ